MKDEQTRLAIEALKAAGCGVLAIHVESRIAELEKDAARYRSSIKEVLDLQLSSYGDGIGTHIELAAWVKKYTAMKKD